MVDLITIVLIAVVVLVLLGLVVWFFGIYNRFFNLKNSAEATLGQIRVAMKKRLDMIEQLLGAVRSYATFEKETLARVTELRASVARAGRHSSIRSNARAGRSSARSSPWQRPTRT